MGDITDSETYHRMASSGVLMRNTLEVAGLGGDVKFVKNTLEGQQHIALPSFGIALAFSGSLGFLQVCHACSLGCVFEAVRPHSSSEVLHWYGALSRCTMP